jgi:hypothetical protein
MHQHLVDNANVFTRGPLFDGLEWLVFASVW